MYLEDSSGRDYMLTMRGRGYTGFLDGDVVLSTERGVSMQDAVS